MSHLGATFYPGGVDDYYMPEVVAPSPQRVMPEVPQNMQQGLQRMELEANSVEPRNTSASASASASSSPAPGRLTQHHGREPSLSTVLNNNTRSGPFGHQYQDLSSQRRPPVTDYSPASNYDSPWADSPLAEKKHQDMRDLPSFSPFPKVSGEHIPPSDEEKEGVLAESRQYVLHSNDPNMQICWARDVLAYVEIASESATREADAARPAGDRDLPGSRPATPKVEHELRLDAINIINYLADQNHPEATFIRSKWLEFGKFGTRQDKKEAYSGYTQAAQQGWPRAEYRIGMLYENSNDMDMAMHHYNMGLAANDSAASYRLGMISLMGQRGQPQNLARGLELIHAAADTADEDAPQGAFVYGMLIARDLPDITISEGALTTDLGLARQYIEKAAYLGFAKAQLKMGQAYELCQIECEFNPALSLHYYGLAAKQGQPEACLGVSRWFLFGHEGTFAKNEQLAFKYAQLAAKTKLPTGEFAMGYYYEIGISVDKDLREARRWYELAAEHGNKDALGRLDGLSQQKTLSKEDHETTTLGRIKSKHGSQRGQRPERFKQSNPMPPLSEDRNSPRPSPHPSPRVPPFEQTGMPDPSRHSTGPAFAINLPDRSRSAAPYPEDDRAAPLGIASRPKSTAPYPEDDIAGHVQPGYNATIRPHAAPVADRAGSAFGIRSHSPGAPPGPGIRPSQSAGQLPIPAAHPDPNRARPVSAGWQAPAQAGYRQPAAGAGRPDPRPQTMQFDQRPGMSGYGPAQANPAQSRLTKQNPNPAPGRQAPPGQPPMAFAPGPRVSSHPASGPSQHDAYGGRASAAPPGAGSPAMSGGLGPRHDSMPQGKPGPPAGRVASAGQPGKPLPNLADGGPGRASAPPQARPPTTASPAPSAGSAASKPKPSKTGQGPATFEQMGIPQGKHDDQCAVM